MARRVVHVSVGRREAHVDYDEYYAAMQEAGNVAATAAVNRPDQLDTFSHVRTNRVHDWAMDTLAQTRGKTRISARSRRASAVPTAA
jgi:hypothetical protein